MDVVVGLGANLGDRQATLAGAVEALDRIGHVHRASSLYETDPIGPPQPTYLNAALLAAIDVSPAELLDALLAVERRFGRTRSERWAARTLDLDILWIADTLVDTPALVVPHPRLLERRFALVPLLEIAPEARHPGTLRPLSESLAQLPAGGVRKTAGPGWAGPIRTARASR